MRYSMELLRTVNKSTGKKRYFKKVCNYFTRISLVEYDEIYDSAFGVSNLFTTSNKTVTKHFTSLSFYHIKQG